MGKQPKNSGQAAYTSVSNPTFTIDDLEEAEVNTYEDPPSTTAVLAVDGKVVETRRDDRRRLGVAFLLGSLCTLLFVVTTAAIASVTPSPTSSASTSTDLQQPSHGPIYGAHTGMHVNDAEDDAAMEEEGEAIEIVAVLETEFVDGGGGESSMEPGSDANGANTALEKDGDGDGDDDGQDSWWKRAWDAIFPEEKHPTKLPGGGRDWLLDAVHGTVSVKSDPSLFLALGPTHLALVPRDDLRALTFHREQIEDGEDGEEGSGGWMKIKVGNDDDGDDGNDEYLSATNADVPMELGQYSVLDTVVASDIDPLFFQYKDDKFITTRDGFVLDIAFWNIVEGSKVNLIRDNKRNTYQAGGGRDFHWNDDGTMSPELNPGLVIGSGDLGLILSHSPSRAVHLEHAQDLANTGLSVDMEFHLANDADRVYKVYLSEEGTSDGWRYRTATASTVDDPDAYVAQITYDGNYVIASEGDYALDVSYWKMVPFNYVNFVGGTDEED